MNRSPKVQGLLATATAGAFAAAMMMTSVPSVARETVTFDPGSVAFAYSDGYWDHDHHWHKWHNAREAHDYRAKNPDHYVAKKHTHLANKGWRDEH